MDTAQSIQNSEVKIVNIHSLTHWILTSWQPYKWPRDGIVHLDFFGFLISSKHTSSNHQQKAVSQLWIRHSKQLCQTGSTQSTIGKSHYSLSSHSQLTDVVSNNFAAWIQPCNNRMCGVCLYCAGSQRRNLLLSLNSDLERSNQLYSAGTQWNLSLYGQT